MPRRRNTVTNLCCETLLLVGIFVAMGHLGVNVWERYLMQKEITCMKTSLHTLKTTIYNISFAYDHLSNELKSLVDATKQYSTQADITQLDINGLTHSSKINLPKTKLIMNEDIQKRIKNFSKELYNNAFESAPKKNEKFLENISVTDKNSERQEILEHYKHPNYKNNSKIQYYKYYEGEQEKKVPYNKSHNSQIEKKTKNFGVCVCARKSIMRNVTTTT